MSKLESILHKAASGASLLNHEINEILEIRENKEIETLFATARKIREKHFGNKIFLYGFLYISTFCRNNCSFCSFRRTNKNIARYRKHPDAVVEAAHRLSASGVQLIDLTMGEDFYYLHGPGSAFFFDTISRVRKETGLPVMVSPGVAPENFLRKCADAGADWYACYQETYNKRLFTRLRAEQDYETRLKTKVFARNLGMLIEEGILSGVGESVENIAESMKSMRSLDPDQVRVMRFVPGCGIPLQASSESALIEPTIIAVLRLLFPDRLIPASLDVEGIAGLKKRLMAGANVVTSIVPAGLGLSGVAQSSMDIETGKRSVKKVLEIAASIGLECGTQEDYLVWINNRKKVL